jgi:hypothetical protein
MTYPPRLRDRAVELRTKERLSIVDFAIASRPAISGAFWGRELAVEPDSIRRQRKANSSQLASRKWRCKYGVVSVGVNDTAFRARLQGWIDSLKNQWVDSRHLGA